MKPREFWIVLNSKSAGPYNSGRFQYDAFNFEVKNTDVPVIHVTEYSAYQKAFDQAVQSQFDLINEKANSQLNIAFMELEVKRLQEKVAVLESANRRLALELEDLQN